MPVLKPSVLALLTANKQKNMSNVWEDVSATKRRWEAQAQEVCTTMDARVAFYEQRASECYELANWRTAEMHEIHEGFREVLQQSEEGNLAAVGRLSDPLHDNTQLSYRCESRLETESQRALQLLAQVNGFRVSYG